MIPKPMTAEEARKILDEGVAAVATEQAQSPLDYLKQMEGKLPEVGDAKTASSPLKTLESMGLDPTRFRMALVFELLDLAKSLPPLAKMEVLQSISRIAQKVFEPADKEALNREGILNDAPPLVNLTFNGFDKAISEVGRSMSRTVDQEGGTISVEIPDKPALPDIPGLKATITSG